MEQPKEPTPAEHNARQQENLAQLEMAQHLYPDKPRTEAFLAFVGDPDDPESPANRFRVLLENDPKLKERIDNGDEGALREVEQLLTTDKR